MAADRDKFVHKQKAMFNDVGHVRLGSLSTPLKSSRHQTRSDPTDWCKTDSCTHTEIGVIPRPESVCDNLGQMTKKGCFSKAYSSFILQLPQHTTVAEHTRISSIL
jgi:hypothetical protein